MLRSLGYDDISRYHMNEGHAALLNLELLGEEAAKAGRKSVNGGDIEKVRSRCVFTTHTPVPAGHDRFPIALVEDVLGTDRARALRGRGTEPDGTVNMTELGLHFARFANGVAMRHARVSREMFPGRNIHA